MAVTFDNSILLNYYQARNGMAGTGAGTASSSGRTKYAPTAPWAATSSAVKTPELVKTALTGRKLIDERAAQLDLKGASEDYRKLFALYQGMSALEGIAAKAGGKNIPAYEMAKLKTTFERGLKEVAAYADVADFDQLRMTNGTVATSLKSTIGVPRNKYDYVTDVLHTGAATDVVPGFSGDAAFEIKVKKLNAAVGTVSIDLADMGATPRTMANVVNHVNAQLKAAGYTSRFGVERTPGVARTIDGADGKKITLPASGDQFALRVRGDASEQLSFNAVSKPAVYVTTNAGNPDPDKDVKTDDAVFENKLLKIDPSGATAPETRIKTETLDANILQVRETKIGPDGSVYMLADVENAIAGQSIKGQKDVALLKYDTAGNIMYARALGAGDTASGMSLAISDDGKIAISGAVKGEMAGTTNGPINSSTSSGFGDSFVTLFDAKGDEVWTVRRGSLDQDEASAVTFGDDGLVYVAGRAKSTMPNGGGAVGGFDKYITAISTTDKGAARVLFTQQFGSTLDDKPAGIVVEGDRLIVAGNENGKAVLRSFDLSRTETKTTKTISGGQLSHTIESYVNGVLTSSATTNYGATTAPDSIMVSNFVSAATATAGATRDLGDLAGGAIAGIAIDGGELVIAGHTRNAALGLGPASQAHAGALDAFAGRLSLDLSSTADDELTYYGGAGDNTVSGFSVSGGKVWVAGSAGADLPGLTASGTKQGYIAALDTTTGAVTGAQRINGKDGIATATSIAVADTGASALDKFGLPKGALDYDLSQKVVGSTSARAGDTFQIRTREGSPPMTITLEANDTLKTLADKIRRKAGYSAKVEVVTSGNNRVLKIQPNNDNAVVEILPGKGGKDMLEALGLDEGIVRRTEFRDGKTVATASGGQVYGLALDLEINLNDKEQIHHAQAVLAAALNKVRAAYKDLEAAAKPPAAIKAEGATGGTAPAYLTAQLANYQAGLARLTGGG